MGFSTDLLTGLAQLLEDKSIGAWRPDGTPYAAGETPIILGDVPQAPDRVITLTAYVVDDDPSLSDSVLGVQARYRTTGREQRATDDLADDVFDAWHGLHDVVLSTGVHVVELLRRSGAPLGKDASNRWSRSDNYYATVHRPSANRT